MRNKKLLTTLATILVLVLMMTSSVFAAGEGSITVTNTNTEVSIVGNTYSAYKLFDVTYTADGSSYVYEIDDTFAAFFAGLGCNTDDEAFEYVLASDPTAFAKTAYEYIMANTVAFDGSATATSETVLIDNIDLGYYLVNGTATANGQSVTSLCMLNTTTPDATVNPKLSVPTLDLTVYEDSEGQYGEVADYTVGEDVPFQIVSTVPENMNGYDDYTYIIHDTLSDGFTFNDDIVVTIGGTPLVEGTDYTVVVSPDGQSISIDIITIKDQTPGAEVIVNFTAVLDEDFVIFNGENPNTAYLEYSNNPYDETSTANTPEDEVVVDTYEVTIIKYTGELISPTYLADAHFALKLTNDTAAAAIAFVKEADGTYRVATADEIAAGTTTTDLVSPTGGMIPVAGIDEGMYYLFETQAPVGYNILEGAIPFEITRDYDTGKAYATASSVVATYTNGTENGVINVQNNAGVQLPETGGMGTTIFTVVGLVLMGAAVTVLVARKRMQRHNK